MTLARHTVERVRELLAEGGRTYREIAQECGCSHGVVAVIARGEWCGDRERFDGRQEASGPMERCVGCGGLTYLPCLLCRARVEAARRPRTYGTDEGDAEDLDLDLDRYDPGERERYEYLRRCKEQGVEPEIRCERRP